MKDNLEVTYYECQACDNEFALSNVFATVKYCPYCGADSSEMVVDESLEPYDFM